jgi:hypothetical protein
MSTYKGPTPEQIARYRNLQLEDPPGGTREEHMRWLKDLVRRKAEALGVPEHVIEAEHEAEAQAIAEYRALKTQERESDRILVRGEQDRFNVARGWLRPIPTWHPEDGPKE